MSTSPATTLFEQQRVIDAYNELAWLQATGSAEVRNGQEAVRNALVACQLANHRDPSCLDTLAAAYAETGDFEQAVGTQEAAIRLLSEVGDEGSILPNLQRRLEAYRSGHPYRGER